jgi:hypothetical protein
MWRDFLVERLTAGDFFDVAGNGDLRAAFYCLVRHWPSTFLARTRSRRSERKPQDRKLVGPNDSLFRRDQSTRGDNAAERREHQGLTCELQGRLRFVVHEGLNERGLRAAFFFSQRTTPQFRIHSLARLA